MSLDKNVQDMTGYGLMPNQENHSGTKNATLGLALMTALGAFGGFPAPSKKFEEFTRNEMVQYGLLFVLIYQGGGAQDPKLTALTTALVFAIKNFLM